MSKANTLADVANNTDILTRNADTLDGNDSLSFRDASNLNIGTLPDARLSSNVGMISYTTIDMTGSGDFTGGTIYVSKVGRSVTISWANLNHPGSSHPFSAVGAIPAAYLPITTANNGYYQGVNASRMATIGTNGQVDFFYYDGSGTAVIDTVTNFGTISYISAT